MLCLLPGVLPLQFVASQFVQLHFPPVFFKHEVMPVIWKLAEKFYLSFNEIVSAWTLLTYWTCVCFDICLLAVHLDITYTVDCVLNLKAHMTLSSSDQTKNVHYTLQFLSKFLFDQV